MFENQSLMINSQQMHNRCLEVMNMYRIFHNIVSEFVCFSKYKTFFYTGTCHPDRKTSRMMITPVILFTKLPLGVGTSSKFPAPYNECFIQQTSLFQIFQQCC